MNILNRFSAAIFGELVFKLLYIPETLILSPVGFYHLFQTLFSTRLAGKILSGFLTASLFLLMLTSWILNPFALLGAGLGFLICQTIYQGFSGALTGWNHGFAGVFKYCAARVSFVICVVTGRPYDMSSRQPAEWNNVVFADQMWSRFMSPQREPFSLDSLMLSQDEIDTLINNQQSSLSTEELDALESLSYADVKKHIENYKILFNRLEEGECCILLDKPESREDTVLLVKLYKNDNHGETWLPVPHMSNIYSKSALTQWLNQNNINPLSRDLIAEPSSHNGHATRYVCHPYYHSTSDTGVSQELSEQIKVLRTYLPKNLQLVSQEDARREEVRAARLRYFAPAPAPAPVSSEVATNDAQMNCSM